MRKVLALLAIMALAVPAFAEQPNQNAGGGSGNSGPGDKSSPVQGPPDGKDPHHPSDDAQDDCTAPGLDC